MTTEFAAVLAALATRLSSQQLRAWCEVLEVAPGPSSVIEAKLADLQAGHGTTSAARQLISSWRTWAPNLRGSAVALSLAAAGMTNDEAEVRRPRLVVSGPTSSGPVRLTSSVVVEVIRAARQRVLVVSFAAHGVAEVVRELVRAASRGVRLDLVLETSVDQGGALRGRGAAAAFSELAGRANFWHWPAEHRRGPVALHAKIVVADSAVAFMSSANLTNQGLSDNLKIGVLLRDADIAGQLDRHFRFLMRAEARCLTQLNPQAEGPAAPR